MTFRLHTDHYSYMGYRHLSDGKPCQDHVLSGVVEDEDIGTLAYAVVSDGCSTGGETDIGARLVTSITAHHFTLLPMPVGVFIERDLRNVARDMGRPDKDLLATQMYAGLNPDGEGLVVVNGDGVVVLIGQSGEMTINRYDWAGNKPFYPFQDLNSFYASHGGGNVKALTVSCWRMTPKGEFVDAGEVQHTVAEGCRGIRIPIKPSYDLSAIVLFSDGVCQIDKIDWLETVKQLTAFKDRKGVFAKRRMMRFIKDSLKLGHGPLDDLSYAVISIEPEDAEQN